MTNFKPLIQWTFLFVFVSASLAVAAEQSLRAQNIAKVTPTYVKAVVVEDQGEGVKISGEIANMQDLSKYMRFLEDGVGSPALDRLKREGDKSNFVLYIKKFKN